MTHSAGALKALSVNELLYSALVLRITLYYWELIRSPLTLSLCPVVRTLRRRILTSGLASLENGIRSD